MNQIEIPPAVFNRWQSWMSELAKLADSEDEVTLSIDAKGSTFTASPAEVLSLIAAFERIAENSEEHAPFRFGDLPP